MFCQLVCGSGTEIITCCLCQKPKEKNSVRSVLLYWMVERAGETRLFPCVKPQSSLFIPRLQQLGPVRFHPAFLPVLSPFLIHFALIKSFHDTIPSPGVRKQDFGPRLQQKWSNLEEIGIYVCVPKSGLPPLEGAAICVFNKNLSV